MRCFVGLICAVVFGALGCGETANAGGGVGDADDCCGEGGSAGTTSDEDGSAGMTSDEDGSAGPTSDAGGSPGATSGELESLLQNACVHREVGDIYFTEGRTLADGRPCGNIIYTYENVCGTDPLPVASACVHYCAFERCQPEPCQSDMDCDWMIETTNTEYECVEYTIDEFSYGKWCREKGPEPPPGLCDPCGGAFCDGECAQCPQCTG